MGRSPKKRKKIEELVVSGRKITKANVIKKSGATEHYVEKVILDLERQGWDIQRQRGKDGCRTYKCFGKKNDTNNRREGAPLIAGTNEERVYELIRTTGGASYSDINTLVGKKDSAGAIIWSLRNRHSINIASSKQLIYDAKGNRVRCTVYRLAEDCEGCDFKTTPEVEKAKKEILLPEVTETRKEYDEKLELITKLETMLRQLEENIKNLEDRVQLIEERPKRKFFWRQINDTNTNCTEALADLRENHELGGD